MNSLGLRLPGCSNRHNSSYSTNQVAKTGDLDSPATTAKYYVLLFLLIFTFYSLYNQDGLGFPEGPIRVFRLRVKRVLWARECSLKIDCRRVLSANTVGEVRSEHHQEQNVAAL
jgi:hypothetical protein